VVLPPWVKALNTKLLVSSPEVLLRQALSGFKWASFCGVERPADHPLKPADYVPLNHFWRRRGFQQMEMVCYMNWKDINEAAESPKPLRFWMKELI
jgi:hypothetical protein